jgi:hypothetical protein
MHLLGKSKYKDKVLSRISEVQYMDGASRKLMDVNESAIGMVEGHWDSSTLGSQYFLVFVCNEWDVLLRHIGRRICSFFFFFFFELVVVVVVVVVVSTVAPRLHTREHFSPLSNAVS